MKATLTPVSLAFCEGVYTQQCALAIALRRLGQEKDNTLWTESQRGAPGSRLEHAHKTEG